MTLCIEADEETVTVPRRAEGAPQWTAAPDAHEYNQPPYEPCRPGLRRRLQPKVARN